MKHTPGPWHVHDGDNRFLFVDSLTEGSVCKIAANGHSEANAQLIAAAPELLEALEAAEPFLGLAWEDWMTNAPNSAQQLEAILENVRAAIRKAKGDL
jgi:hypothetical protein